jgi:hypothetical protein
MIINNKIPFFLLSIISTLLLLLNNCAVKNNISKEDEVTQSDTNQDTLNLNDEFYKEEMLRYEDFVYQKNIKSVLLHKRGLEIGEPFLILNSNEQLILRFDELDAEFNTYQYQFIHCNTNWEKSNLNEMDFISGFNDNYIENSEKSFNTHQQYVHYWTSFPNQDVSFLISGNYIINVYKDNNPEKSILTKKFFISEQTIFPEINISYPSNIDQKYYQQEVDFNLNYASSKIINPYSNIKVFVQQNHRTDNQISEIEPKFIRENKLVYDYDQENVFDGGNEFRYINLTSFQTEIDKIAKAELTDSTYEITLEADERRTYKRYLEKPDINGKLLIKTVDGQDWNTEGDYANVKFSLPYRNTLNQGDLYIYGQISNWKISPEYQLKYHSATATYQKDLFLKNGYYNYLYLYVSDTAKSADIRHVEGSHFDTENEYLFKVYYSDPGDFYDRLLLYHVANSRKSF